MAKIDLNGELQQIYGMNVRRAQVLEKELGVRTPMDLLQHYPYKYLDRSRFVSVGELDNELAHVQLKGKFSAPKLRQNGKRQWLVADFTDETGSVEVVWFKALDWIQRMIRTDVEYVLFGKPGRFGSKLNFTHPDTTLLEDYQARGASLEAVYNTSETMKKAGLHSKAVARLIENVLREMPGLPETLGAELLERMRLPGRAEAVRELHLPSTGQALGQATFRLKFEELFYIQLSLLRQMGARKARSRGLVFEKVGQKFNTFYNDFLPFPLTGAQKRVLKEIRRDLGSGRHCNRLLQGDVGSGKTLVALMLMLLALDNGFQACLMAPTEILATQHRDSLRGLLGEMPVRVELLTGSTKAKERARMLEDLASGQLDIVVGTHALLEDRVVFQNLGLVVVDEQHRFGVAQRARMWAKNEETPPHVVVMTATPIPRTLAMTLYGDLEISVIDELPPGRKPIATAHLYDSQRLRVFKLMREEIGKGRQVYVVYPLINESEHEDFQSYKDLNDGYESITRAFPPPQYAVSVVHGQMKPEEKEKAMRLFAEGKTQIMVATTVIEVGVNVPNASVMVIESADRFGLSQLHQLRGRVGRGAERSFCVLMTDHKLSADARKRLGVMCETNDGFRIAEEDLKLRGPGDIEGTQQSGLPMSLKIADLSRDGQILEEARRQAGALLEADPKLEHPDNQVYVRQIERQRAGRQRWEAIS